MAILGMDAQRTAGNPPNPPAPPAPPGPPGCLARASGLVAAGVVALLMADLAPAPVVGLTALLTLAVVLAHPDEVQAAAGAITAAFNGF